MKPNERVFIKSDVFVESIRNGHVQTSDDVYKSFGYRVCKVKSKLKPEFAGLSQHELNGLMRTKGKESMTEEVIETLLTYTGDTPLEDKSKWDDTKILIHEATFLDGGGKRRHNTRGNLHSNLDDVMAMAAEMNIETLILGHFSSRYTHQQIDDKIKSLARDLRLKIPVYRLLPGVIYKDILGGGQIV